MATLSCQSTEKKVELTGVQKLERFRIDGEKSTKLDTVLGGFILGSSRKVFFDRKTYLLKNDPEWYKDGLTLKTKIKSNYSTLSFNLDCYVYEQINLNSEVHSIRVLISSDNNNIIPCMMLKGVASMIYEKYGSMEEIYEKEVTGIEPKTCDDIHYFKNNMEIIIKKEGDDYIELEYRFLPLYRKAILHEDSLKKIEEKKSINKL